MINKNLLITVLAITFQLICFSSFAVQDTTYWRKEAKFIVVEEEVLKHGDAVILEDNRFVKLGGSYREVTRHKIIHIKTQEGLDDHNKVVVHLSNAGTLINVKGRSISVKGNVVEIKQTDVKEMKNYKKGGQMRMFAIKGAEVGGQIEYTYTIRTPLYDSGKEMFSMDYRTLHACMLIRGITKFKFDSKSLNWEYDKSMSINEHRYIYKDILPIADEKYSTPKAHRVAVEYKILGDSYSKSTYSTYPNAIRSLRKIFSYFLQKETRKVAVLLKQFTGKVEGDELQTLRNLTVFLKKKLVYKRDYASQYSDVIQIIKTGVGNDKGLMKVYCIALKELNIDYEILVTCNKYEGRLLESYCSRYTLDKYVFYFPKHSSYLYPVDQLAHFGVAPPWIVGSKALVLPEVGIETEFREIRDQDPDSNLTFSKIDVQLDLNNMNSIFDISASGSGQLARKYNRYIYYADTEEEKKEEIKGLVDWRYPDAQILYVDMVDKEKWGDISQCEDYSCKREYVAKVKSTSFFEKVGDKVLLKVGSLLGPQVELYSELERVQPITTSYNKGYLFDISIPIPEGYKYSGAEGLEIENELVDRDGNSICGFKSIVNVEDNILNVLVYEFYAEINVSKEYYDQYRIVINSAADFNKGMILLEKE